MAQIIAFAAFVARVGRALLNHLRFKQNKQPQAVELGARRLLSDSPSSIPASKVEPQRSPYQPSEIADPWEDIHSS
jgi:hypothetical protein